MRKKRVYLARTGSEIRKCLRWTLKMYRILAGRDGVSRRALA
jgi:hypothetical protein